MQNCRSSTQGKPEATSVAVDDFGPNDTTLPVWGVWGSGPPSAMRTVSPNTTSPVGTLLSKLMNAENPPSRLTRRTGLSLAPLTRAPPRPDSIVHCNAIGG